MSIFFQTKNPSKINRLNKKKALLKRGWKFGTVKEFLGLSDSQEREIEYNLLTHKIDQYLISKGISDDVVDDICEMIKEAW